jgi:hypothetical protein
LRKRNGGHQGNQEGTNAESVHGGCPEERSRKYRPPSATDTWNVTARISASGNATASPGDLQGGLDSVTAEDGEIAIRINERVE